MEVVEAYKESQLDVDLMWQDIGQAALRDIDTILDPWG